VQLDGRDSSASDSVARLVRSGTDASDLLDGLARLHDSYEERQVERNAADGARRIDIDARSLLVFVGKLIPQKGVHLLLAALPRVLERHPRAQLAIAGFGPLRDGLEAMLVAMTRGDVAALDVLADGMGSLSGEGGAALPHLRGFLDLLRDRDELHAWLELCRTHQVDEHVSWFGLVDHGVLAELWPLAETSIVPSVLAEAFGMVAAEAAASGCVPIVADHSGLADAASVIERDGVDPVRFTIDEPLGTAVDHLADAIIRRLDLAERERARQSAAARANVAAAWGWDELAARVAQLMTGA
jgi:glycosyltransferase involved in cell wall biosynthesis